GAAGVLAPDGDSPVDVARISGVASALPLLSRSRRFGAVRARPSTDPKEEPLATAHDPVLPDATRPSRRLPPLWRVAQLTALSAVAALLALLVWRVLDAGRGPGLVNAIRAGERPAAPPFRLRLIWTAAETWPQSLVAALSDRTLALDELRGHAIVLNF